MGKVAVFVLGPDRPGIIAAVSQTLFELGSNLEDVSQTALQTEFVGIFVASLPPGLTEEALGSALRERLAPMGLFVHLRPVDGAALPGPPGEPFVLTTVGQDRPGLVAGITGVLAAHRVNITNMKALPRGEPGHAEYVTYYEVDIPAGLDQHALRGALSRKARELGLDVNFQHRAIFEQVHRI